MMGAPLSVAAKRTLTYFTPQSQSVVWQIISSRLPSSATWNNLALRNQSSSSE